MTYPVRVFTEEEILTGNRNTRFVLDILNSRDTPERRLEGVTDGRLDWVANALIKGGGELTVKDVDQAVNWLTVRLRPTMIIDGLPEQPLGVFLVSEAPESWDKGRSWAVKLLDKCSIIDQDVIDRNDTVTSGTVVTDEVDAILDTIDGLTSNDWVITPSAATTPGPMIWPPGTSKLRQINDLLGIIGYFALYANLEGKLVAEPYVLPAARPIVYEFLDGEKSIYEPGFNRDYDIYKIPNKVIAIAQADMTTAALTSTVTNTDPDSPYSIANRGRTIAHVEEGVEITSQAALDAYARRRLVELTTPTAGVEIRHSPLPGLMVNNTVRFRRVPAGIDARHTVSKTQIVLKGNALATSTLREVVDL